MYHVLRLKKMNISKDINFIFIGDIITCFLTFVGFFLNVVGRSTLCQENTHVTSLV